MPIQTTTYFDGKQMQQGDRLWWRGDDGLVVAMADEVASEGLVQVSYHAQAQVIVVRNQDSSLLTYNATAAAPGELNVYEWMLWRELVANSVSLGVDTNASAITLGQSVADIGSLDITVEKACRLRIRAAIRYSTTTLAAGGNVICQLKLGTTVKDAVSAHVATGEAGSGGIGLDRTFDVSAGDYTVKVTGVISTGVGTIGVGALEICAESMG